MKKPFKDIRIVDNFYQTSSFFPMPTILIGTLCENGLTNLGSYSLCFPYYIAGKDYYAMILECRNSSNTAQNLLRNGKCSLNFISHRRKYLKEAVRLGYPGDTPEEKMKDCIFTMAKGEMAAAHPEEYFPLVVEEAFQVFECSWVRELDGAENDTVQEEYSPPYHDFNGITCSVGAHFILKIDKILVKERQYNAIINGTTRRTFPKVPVDWGFRDNTKFWISRFRPPVMEKLPFKKGNELEFVVYASDRIDPEVKFTEDACAKLVRVPRVFLNTVLKGCVSWAKENNVTLLTADHMEMIQDKRSAEKRGR